MTEVPVGLFPTVRAAREAAKDAGAGLHPRLDHAWFPGDPRTWFLEHRADNDHYVWVTP